jgi:hypothetical protein
MGSKECNSPPGHRSNKAWSYQVKSYCPICGDTVTVVVVTEYQGEHPMGGYVDFVDEIKRDCTCEWTDEQEDEVVNNATYDEPEPDLERD